MCVPKLLWKPLIDKVNTLHMYCDNIDNFLGDNRITYFSYPISEYMSTHVCLCLSMFVYVCVCVYVRLYMFVYVCVCLCTFVYICVCLSMFVYVYICLYAFVYVFICLCMSVYVCQVLWLKFTMENRASIFILLQTSSNDNIRVVQSNYRITVNHTSCYMYICQPKLGGNITWSCGRAFQWRHLYDKISFRKKHNPYNIKYIEAGTNSQFQIRSSIKLRSLQRFALIFNIFLSMLLSPGLAIVSL